MAYHLQPTPNTCLPPGLSPVTVFHHPEQPRDEPELMPSPPNSTIGPSSPGQPHEQDADAFQTGLHPSSLDQQGVSNDGLNPEDSAGDSSQTGPRDSTSAPINHDVALILPTAARPTFHWWRSVPNSGVPFGLSRPTASNRGPVYQSLEAASSLPSEPNQKVEQTILSQRDWRVPDYQAEHCLGPGLQALLLADPPGPSSLGPIAAPMESSCSLSPQAIPLNFYEETPDTREGRTISQLQNVGSNTSALQSAPDSRFVRNDGTEFYVPTGYGLPYTQRQQSSFLPPRPPIPVASDSTFHQSPSSFPAGENQGAPEDAGNRLAEAYRLVYEDQLRRDQLRRASIGGLSDSPAYGHQAVASKGSSRLPPFPPPGLPVAPGETWRLPTFPPPGWTVMRPAEAEMFYPRNFAGYGEQSSQDRLQSTTVQSIPVWNPVPERKTSSGGSNNSDSKLRELDAGRKMAWSRAMTASSRPPTSPLQTRPTTDRFPRPADARLTAEQIAWLDDNVVYIIKAGGEADVRASIGTAICSAGKAGNERLSKAFEERKQGSRVLLLFSVGGSGKFCGLAEMVGPWKRQAVSSIWSVTQPSGHFAVHWIMLKDASFAAFSHLLDPDDEMQPATYMRDSCRIHPDVARKTVTVYLQHPRGPNLIDRAPNWFRDNNRFAHLRGDAGAGPSGPPETSKRPFDPTPGGHRGRTRAGASAAGHRRVAPGPSIASYHDSGRPVSAVERSRRRPEEPDNAQAWTNQQHNQAPRSNERGNWAAAKKPENTE